MAFESSSWGEFAELVTDHILSDEDGDVLFAVIDGEGVLDEGRIDGLTSRPGLDDFFFAGFIEILDLLKKVSIYERAFFART